MIALSDYWMGRDAAYPLAMSPQIERNALTVIELANKLLILAKASGVRLIESPKTGTVVSSGWRPPAINAKTPGASQTSLHMTGEAIDLYDPNESIDDWMYANSRVLQDLGVWVEHRDYTKGWAHLQSKPPRSGNRFFIPR